MEKKDTAYQLSAEIWRIVSSPYPVSLKSLHDILSLDKDGQAFFEYSASNPCKLKALASCIVDAIECQRFGVDLLRQLCISDVFRSEVLRLKPELLDTLLAKATTGHDEYKSLCTQILRFQLPQSIALPASAEAFFVAVVKDAVRSPSARSLTAAYDLLAGACQNLPQILPRPEWSKLEDGLVKIVKSSRTIQDQCLSLLCLGILRVLARHQPEARSEGNVNANGFFAGSKALKSLSLAILQAVWITKSTNYTAKVDILRSLEIALHVVCAMPSDQLDCWSTSVEGQGGVKRLLSQCQDMTLHIEIRLMLWSIIARIYRPHALPTRLVSELIAFMSDRLYLGAGSTVFGLAIEEVLPPLMGASPSETFQKVMHHVTRAMTSSYRTLEIQNLSILLKVIQITLVDAPLIAVQLQPELHSIDSYFLDRIVSQSGGKFSCDLLQALPGVGVRTQQALVRDIASLGLASEAIGLNASLNRDRIVANMRLLGYLRSDVSVTQCICANSPSLREKPLVLTEEQCSDPQLNSPSWREHIRVFSNQQSEWQEQKLLRVISGICGDLEERCGNAEKPFREAERKAGDLQRLVTVLQSRNAELEQDVADLTVHLSTAETEKLELRDSLQGENERLIERVQTLDQALRESNKSGKAQLERLQSESKTRELQLRTAVTEKEMLLDEATAECEGLRRLHCEATAALDDAKHRAAERTKERDGLKTEIDRKTKEVEALKRENQSMGDEIGDVAQARQDTEAALESARAEVQQFRDQIRQSESDHATELAKAETQLRDEESHHATAIGELQQGFAAERYQFEAQVDQLQASLEAEKVVKDELQRRYSEAETVMHDQEREVEELQDTVAARDEKIAEFQAMRQTLAAAINHLPERKHPRKSVHYALSVDRFPQPRRQSRRLTEKRTASPLKNAESTKHGAKTLPPDAALSFESVSTEHGSTPKRAKLRKPFKLPVACQPRLSTMATPKSVKSRSQRAPLTEISTTRGNRSPSRQMMTSMRMTPLEPDVKNLVMHGAGYTDLDELNFGSEISTSTPFTPARVVAYDDDDDDQTVDQ